MTLPSLDLKKSRLLEAMKNRFDILNTMGICHGTSSTEVV